MPRTKRPTKKPEKALEEDDTLKKFDKIVADQKRKIDELVHLRIRNIKNAFKLFTRSIADEHLNMTVGQLRSELHFKEPSLPKEGQFFTRPASADDGYITENSSHSSGGAAMKHFHAAPTPRGGRSTSRRSRSADPTARKPAPRARDTSASSSQRRASRNVYRTPALNKHLPHNYPLITPKVAPQTPLTVLRQPRLGEMVVSMDGSPVMVPTYSSMQHDEKANCNILLHDGTMLSLQPKQLRQSQVFIPFSLMDSNVLDQLRTLRENLDKVVRLGEHSCK